MKRTTLTDGSGRWFNPEAAESFNEDTWWNGSNWISTATGNQVDHETLYRTAGKQWILHSYSDYQGKPDAYVIIEDEGAAKWLSINKHEPHRDCEGQFNELEIK